jgi:transposase
MKKRLKNKQSRKRCGYTQRWQVETTASMLKRNLGSALRGKSKQSREHDMLLKVLTHNIMLLAADDD